MAVIAWLAFGQDLSRLGIYADDWTVINGAYLYGWEFQKDFISSDRPLHAILHGVYNAVFGIHLIPRYIVHFLILGFNALLVFLLVEVISGRRLVFAFLTAALFLVYPTISSYSWISAGPMHLAVTLFLAALVLFVRSLPAQSGWRVVVIPVITAIIFLISVLIYELHLGLALMFPLLAFLSGQGSIPWRIRDTIRRTLPLAIVLMLYLGYRFLLKPAANLEGRGPDADYWSIQPGAMLQKVLAMRGDLLTIWKLILQQEWETEAELLLLVGLVIAVLVTGIAVLLRWGPGEEAGYRGEQRAPGQRRPHLQWRWALTMAGFGLLWVLLGYAALLPSVYWPAWPNALSSRVGYAAAVGAAIFASSLAYLTAVTVSRIIPFIRATSLFALGMCLLIALNIAHSRNLQQDYFASWQQQSGFYRQLLEIAPEIADGTLIILVDPPKRADTMPVISFAYNAVRLLYDNPTVDAAILETTRSGEDNPVFTSEGVIPHPWTLKPHGYDSLLIVAQDRHGCVSLLDSMAQALPIQAGSQNSGQIRSNKDLIRLDWGEPPPARRLLRFANSACSS